MLDNQESNEQSQPDPGNERWLAMRSAYVEYVRVSEALEAAAHVSDDSYPPEHWELATLVGQQRVAFERYLEARMEYLEFRFDERQPGPGSAATPPAHGVRHIIPNSLFARYPLVLQVLTAGILGITILSLVHEHQQVRSLEAARDQLSATLGDTRQGLHLLATKMDASKPAEPLPIPQTDRSAQASAPVQSAARPKPLNKGRWRRLPDKLVQKSSASQTSSPDSRSRGTAPPAYRQFSLERSHQFKRIGPIEVSLTSVDTQRNSVSLSIVTDSGNMHFDHLKPNQPVWINTGGHRRGLELIVDRIAKGGLYGHLIELAG
jgi:hypothetical protein